MSRSSFTPPAEDDDVLNMLASPARPAGRELRVAPPPSAPAVKAREQAPAAVPAPRSEAAAAAAPVAVPVNPEGPTKTPEPGGAVKRVGLYVDTNRWLWFKKVSVERAAKGLPSDFTSIVLEALDEKYGRL